MRSLVYEEYIEQKHNNNNTGVLAIGEGVKSNSDSRLISMWLRMGTEAEIFQLQKPSTLLSILTHSFTALQFVMLCNSCVYLF